MVDGDGRFAAGKDCRTFRRRDEVFAYAAATTPDGTVQVSRAADRWVAGDQALDDELTARFGDPVRVLPEQGVSHFDASPVSIVGTATLDWCARELGVDADRRRLRTNLIVETAEPFEEEALDRQQGRGRPATRPSGWPWSSASSAAARSTSPRTA